MSILKCNKCGKDRILTNKSAYEAQRMGRTLCNACSKKNKPPRGSKYDSLISKGDVFGKRTVISDKVSASGAWVEVKCECGTISRVKAKLLLEGKRLQCKECSKGKLATNWKGIGEMPMTVYTKIKLGAIRRGIDFSLTPEYISDLYYSQNKKCALSGMDIDFGLDDTRNLSEYTGTASLDRINSSKGYIPGNVQWVHVHINFMKLNHDQEYFKKLCKMVIDHG